MVAHDDAYLINDCNLFEVRNRYEVRVIRSINRMLAGKGRDLLSEKDIMDIYALSLNQLPAHYTQRGTIVLGAPFSDETVDEIVLRAYDTVMDFPKP